MNDQAIGLVRASFRHAKFLSIGLGISMVLLAGSAEAAAQDENLVVPIPAGFKVVTQSHDDRVALTEMVPNAESAGQWTQMVTTQIYFGKQGLSFDTYKADMEQRWKAGCDATASAPVAAAKENGYDFRIWLQSCRFNDPSRPPESAWFKMIQGNDNTYIVQVTSHVEMAPSLVKQWMLYLQRVMVCDARLQQLACPASR